MVKVITYGTYDLLHHGHIRLLERAKELGDYLIVGVTADDFDKTRGKINVQQSLMERIETVRSTGIADEIIVEEYEGQKIDDINRYGVDIFTVGSDWEGKFDYLKEYCDVVYLDRTQGISSSKIREDKGVISLGLVGDALFLNKVASECNYVNGISISGICTSSLEIMSSELRQTKLITKSFECLLDFVDAVYIRSLPEDHYEQIKMSISKGKHVICESPLTLSGEETIELLQYAKEKNVVLMETLKTAYATAYERLLLLIKGGKIGDVVSVDATCTSIRDKSNVTLGNGKEWSGLFEWAPTALLPVFQILGTNYVTKQIVTRLNNEKEDEFTKMDFIYNNAVATIKVADGVKSESELIISGTNGYIYVPAPWWKTDYFEIRKENPSDNRRYFYQLDGEGIRYEMVAFVKAIESGRTNSRISEDVSKGISEIMQSYIEKKSLFFI